MGLQFSENLKGGSLEISSLLSLNCNTLLYSHFSLSYVDLKNYAQINYGRCAYFMVTWTS